MSKLARARFFFSNNACSQISIGLVTENLQLSVSSNIVGT